MTIQMFKAELILDIKVKTNPLFYSNAKGLELVNKLLLDHNLPKLDLLELKGYGVDVKEHPYCEWVSVKVWI